jgi:hypothetical protein
LKNKKNLINRTTTLCDLPDLCDPVRSLFGKGLMPLGKDLSWLLEQTSGLFLVVDGLHCVGVDCTRGLILDCAFPTAFKLCLGAFTHCGIVKADEMRQVI